LKPSRKSIQRIFKVKKYSNLLFSYLQSILIEYGINTQKLLTSLNIQRNGGMKIVKGILRPIDNSNISKTENVSRV